MGEEGGEGEGRRRGREKGRGGGEETEGFISIFSIEGYPILSYPTPGLLMDIGRSSIT